ncbi:Rossmann-fold NAD(P)-binding domain-containing protein [Bacilliculturomica massiliensis]|uniref:lactate dehydrogenase n=1 Tax=Bacilliculturomica massiliensis TaxID=1917867 RepID=UPI001A9281FB|nr:lactate dehydrogenase [Bacilliculturomica massiliensis]
MSELSDKKQEQGNKLRFWEVEQDPLRGRGICAVTHMGMLGGEGISWLDSSRLGPVLPEPAPCLNTAWGSAETLLEDVRPAFFALGASGTGVADGADRADGHGAGGADVADGADRVDGAGRADIAEGSRGAGEKPRKKARVNLLALGDVGGTVLIGLKLLGGDVISQIGICDLDPQMCRRWEYEMNQTAYPWDYDALPEVRIVESGDLFDCDAFVFCASKAVPALGQEGTDVRMAQFDANRKIVGTYARMAREANFKGLFAVVSDPVEPLCREAFRESNRPESVDGCGAAADLDGRMFDGKGLRPEQIQGYGLGVMNGRAAYYAKKDERFASFLTEGRAYGPHGKDLVIANSIEHYDDQISRELTKLAAEANLRTRETGFKPYVAPALSSAAISIILTLREEWHYSSVFLGGVYMGCKNRFSPAGLETEALPLPEKLFDRLKYAYEQLERIE